MARIYWNDVSYWNLLFVFWNLIYISVTFAPAMNDRRERIRSLLLLAPPVREACRQRGRE